MLTTLPLGDHTFAVGANDHVGNVSPTESVTFSIVVTPESLIQAITIFAGLGDINSTLVRSRWPSSSAPRRSSTPATA